MIERERIEAIKRDVDLAALVRAKGVKLRKNGKSYFGLCPFHGDKNPSFLRTIQKLLGHASLTSTQIYTHLSIVDLKQAHKRCHPREKDRE